MRNRLYILALAVVALLGAGCVTNEMDGVSPKDGEISLWGGIARTSTAYYAPTRGTASSTSGILDPTYNGTLNIGMSRVSKKEDPDHYPDFRELDAPMVATLGLPDADNAYYRPIEFTHQAQFFPDAKNELRYVGWYPWNESDLSDPLVDDDGSTFYSDNLKTEVTIEITGSKDVLYGDVIEGRLEGEGGERGFPAMEFNHALCLYRVYAYAMVAPSDDDDDSQTLVTDQWGEIDRISLLDLPTEVVLTLPHACIEEGSGHADVDNFTIAYTGNDRIDLHDPSNDIFFDAPEHLPIGIVDAVLVSKCIAAPPTSGVMNIEIHTSEQTATQEVSIARNFQPGHAYDIILRFSDHGLINADVSVGEWTTYENNVEQTVGARMYFDLSSYETANCYVVSAANYSYTFDGTVKGNGDAHLLGVSDADVAVGGDFVKLLWEDIPTFDHDGDGSTPEVECFSLQSDRVTEGKVLFNIQGYVTYDAQGHELIDNKALPVEGNALVGVFDKDPDTDPTARLLWTWHIWVTDKPQGLGCSGGYVIMDRNLGATDVVPTGAADDHAEGLYYQWGRPVPLKVDGIATSSELLTFENFYPEHNPNVLYGSGSVGHGWLSDASVIHPHHDHMWGDTSIAFETPRKTLLDPCPPGYFVTPHAFWQGVEKYEVENSFQSGVGVALNMASNTFWLPCQSIINDEGVLNEAFTGVALRTSTVYRPDEGEDFHHTPYYLAYTASKTAKVDWANSYGNYAIPVRCISEATDPVVVDLSASQTANCYMVNSAGYYKFKANVRGNGVSQLFPYGGNSMLDISDGLSVDIKPAKVDFLWWQGDLTEVTNTDADKEIINKIEIMYGGALNAEGYVMFRVEELHGGNAILAAYDNAGTILWTWHLWFTKDKPKDITSGWRALQDRALGATQAPVIGDGSLTFVDYAGNEYAQDTTDKEAVWATYGFYYQWGRKDPILGAPVGVSGNESVSGSTLSCSPYWYKDYATGEWSLKTTIPHASSVDVSESVESPMTFYRSSSEGGADNSQWFSPSFTVLVDGHAGRNVALWGYAVADYGVAGEDFSKTMFDPCPPGYRTPFHDMWRYSASYMYGGADNEQDDTAYWYNGEGNYGSYGFVTTKTYFDKAWFPYAGRRSATTGGYTNVTSYGYLNTGMPMGQYDTRAFQYTSGSSRQYVYDGTAFGKPIRCMKE